jgi:hypothetical protein
MLFAANRHRFADEVTHRCVFTGALAIMLTVLVATFRIEE